MNTINGLAADLIQLLADAATAPETKSPYMTQQDLMDVLDISKAHTMSDVVTRAVFMVADAGYPGYAILRSRQYGYRLADNIVVEELKAERARAKLARTALKRVGISVGVASAIPEVRHNAAMPRIAVTMLDTYIDSLDEVIEA